jgi:hypothetical protein
VPSTFVITSPRPAKGDHSGLPIASLVTRSAVARLRLRARVEGATRGIIAVTMQDRLVSCAAVCVVVLACTAVAQPALGTLDHTQAAWRTLRNERVGYSLLYPRGWKVAAKLVATQFTAHARCQSVRVVDRAGPTELRRSLVQICWKPITDGSSLAAFMRRTYGSRLSHLFTRATLGGAPAFRTRSGNRNRTFFVQTKRYRMQIVASVVAAPARRARRLAQVNRILTSFSLSR